MTYLRHARRHVHQTMFKHIEHHIGLLGWTNAATTPFSAPVVDVQGTMPEEYEEIKRLQPGRLGITLGPVPAPMEQEMGGPLVAVEYPFFFDCFMDTDAAAVALADDVADILHGYIPNTSTYLKVFNFTTGTPVAISGWQMEIDDVVRTKADGWKNWQITKATATLYYNLDDVDNTGTGYPSATWA
jgi:hypothetical protein